jgi:hypothetical protein
MTMSWPAHRFPHAAKGEGAGGSWRLSVRPSWRAQRSLHGSRLRAMSPASVLAPPGRRGMLTCSVRSMSLAVRRISPDGIGGASHDRAVKAAIALIPCEIVGRNDVLRR